jgi:serine/threonine protein kinase
VYECTNKKTKKVYAVKVIDKSQVGADKKMERRIAEEIKILQKGFSFLLTPTIDLFSQPSKHHPVI